MQQVKNPCSYFSEGMILVKYKAKNIISINQIDGAHLNQLSRVPYLKFKLSHTLLKWASSRIFTKIENQFIHVPTL